MTPQTPRTTAAHTHRVRASERPWPAAALKLLVVGTLALCTSPAAAQTQPTRSPASVHATPPRAAAPKPAPLRVDVEIDPTAYALGGHSLHVGIAWRSLRLDLGAFAMDVPEMFHGNAGFDAAFSGYGAKLQFFVLRPQSGLFVGAEVAVARTVVRKRNTQLGAQFQQLNLGGQVGWRFVLGHGFYVTPWIGLGAGLAPSEVAVGDATFENSRLLIFPAVHVGRRF